MNPDFIVSAQIFFEMVGLIKLKHFQLPARLVPVRQHDRSANTCRRANERLDGIGPRAERADGG
jgi:hypothetical protein